MTRQPLADFDVGVDQSARSFGGTAPMQARFGIIEIPRNIESAQVNAGLAEDHGFDMVGVADSQSLFQELFVTLGMIGEAT